MIVVWSILAGADRMELENGMELRLLSALEVLEARREAAQLAESQGERALCSNACLLARALESGEKPVFDSGRAVLAGLTVSEIAALAGRWREFDRKENPSAARNSGGVGKRKKKTSRQPRGSPALEGAEAVRRSAHREAGQTDEGAGLPVVPAQPTAR